MTPRELHRREQAAKDKPRTAPVPTPEESAALMAVPVSEVGWVGLLSPEVRERLKR